MRLLVTTIVLISLAGAAAAQNASDNPYRASTTGMAASAGPVGHRQPTLSDLPPQDRRQNEDFRRAGQGPVDPLGPLPKICNNC